MITAILAWVLDTWAGRITVALIVALISFRAWLYVHDGKLVQQAQVRVIQKVEDRHVELVKKGSEARRAAGGPGAADRLQQRYCSDC